MWAGFKPAPTPHPHRKRLAEARKAREAIRRFSSQRQLKTRGTIRTRFFALRVFGLYGILQR